MWSKFRSYCSARFQTTLHQSEVGMSIIEIILAVGLLAIIAGSAVGAVLSSLQAAQLAQNQAAATSLAEEGLTAVESIRNRDWSLLSAGTYGLSQTGGSWELSGSSEVVDEKYTRQVIIATVERDGSNQIVSSGGSVDDQTWLATVQVSWNASPTRQNQVELEQYFTNWGVAAATVGGDGGPGPSPSPTVSPSPTPPVTTCSLFCQTQGFGTGTCRANANQCGQNGETYQSGGNLFCTGGGGADTCCCL